MWNAHSLLKRRREHNSMECFQQTKRKQKQQNRALLRMVDTQKYFKSKRCAMCVIKVYDVWVTYKLKQKQKENEEKMISTNDVWIYVYYNLTNHFKIKTKTMQNERESD